MGIQLPINDGLNVGATRRLPFATQGKHNSGVPSLVVTLKETPTVSLRFEYNVARTRASVRGSRRIIVDNLSWLLRGFGLPLDVSGPLAGGGKAPAAKKSNPLMEFLQQRGR